MKSNGLLLIALVAVLLLPAGAAKACNPEVVWLLRHAEKIAIEGERDPPLSARGQARSEALAELLAPGQPDVIYSTDYARTRDTVGPLAVRTGVDITIVDAGDTEGLIAGILSQCGQRVVVAGHSNTVPALVNGLGIEEVIVLDEKKDYGDLFELRWEAGEAVLDRRRFGD